MSVDDATVVDFVTVAPDGGVILIMVEGRPWDGSRERLWELQAKLNTYARFVESGQLVEKYPTLAGKPVAIQLRCTTEPDEPTARFLTLAQTSLGSLGLSFSVRLIGQRPSG